MGRIAGVILAAGAATRLGGRKQLLVLDGQPILAHVLQRARQTALDPLVVVLGSAAEEIQTNVDLGDTEVVLNPAFAEGLSSSVRAAVQALPDDVKAAVFLLGDQPELAPEVIDIILATYRETQAPLVQPRYAEGRGNPVLVARSLFPELLAVQGDAGARPLLQRHTEAVALADARAYSRPDDIDAPADYAAAQARWARAHSKEAG